MIFLCGPHLIYPILGSEERKFWRFHQKKLCYGPETVIFEFLTSMKQGKEPLDVSFAFLYNKLWFFPRKKCSWQRCPIFGFFSKILEVFTQKKLSDDAKNVKKKFLTIVMMIKEPLDVSLFFYSTTYVYFLMLCNYFWPTLYCTYSTVQGGQKVNHQAYWTKGLD